MSVIIDRTAAAAAVTDARAAAALKQVTIYQAGFMDGVDEILAQIEGSRRVAGTDPYHGPVPGELRDWIRDVRRIVKEARDGR
jgi:hypothetical protein